MASSYSFDIVSQVDLQEVQNAVNQASKELHQRFDLKGSNSRVDWDEKKSELRLHSSDDYKLKAVNEILRQKLLKRNVSVKSLEYKEAEASPSGEVKQHILIRQGIAQDKAKDIVKMLKKEGFKVQSQIQQDQIRVTSKSKDDLQAVMQFLRQSVNDIHLDFVNYR
ncbi:YajQ family cyclic di-GMP-binding protein [PVC group bacterium]|nr:YajQ family cyclic di-GMP-binding protein [PVC group bacterium]